MNPRASTVRPAASACPPRFLRRGLAAAAAALFLASPSAHAELTGTLYPGLGYDVVTGPDGNPVPVGYLGPTLSYTLPGSFTGGHAAGRGAGAGSAQYASPESFLGYRGIVMTAGGAYALGTLGANSVAGWNPVGMASSTAQGVSGTGLVAGSSDLWSADGTQSFGGRPVWYAAGETTPHQLAMPPGFTDPSGVGYSGSSSISPNDIIVGWAQSFRNGASDGMRALRWMTPTSAPELLQGLPGRSPWGGPNSSPVAVNRHGTVVGDGNTFDASGNLRGNSAIRWEAGTTAATPLGHLGTAADGTFSSAATGINDQGTAVGSSAKYDDAHNPQGDAAVRWPAKLTKPVDLGNLGVGRDGQSWTYALGINDAGMIFGVGQEYTPAGDRLGWRAIRWLPGSDKPHALKPLTLGLSGATYQYAYAINRKGWIAGMANAVLSASGDFSNPAHLDVHAVVWGPDGSIHDLNKLLPPGSPWQLYGAFAISDSGLVTGLGYYTPEGHGVDWAYPRLWSMQLEKFDAAR